MNCAAAREALSALLDGEAPGSDPAAARAHAEGCADCARWYDRAEQLGRQVRVAPVDEPGPDVTEAVMARVELPQRGRWRGPLRIALLAAAVAQLVIGLVAAFGPVGMHGMHGMDVSVPSHVNHEEAAFNLAFGVGLLVVGINTRAARHQVPVLASLVGVLAVGSAFDLAHGIVDGQRLVTHVPLVVGLVLAAALRRGPHSDPGPERHADGLLPRPRTERARELPDGAVADRHGTPPPAARREAA